MLGIILAGGKGSRLYPIALSINKTILPVGGKPMIYYPISTLAKSGIKQILIIIGGPLADQVVREVNNFKKDFKEVNFKFVKQKQALGMPDAISYAASNAAGGPIIVIAADNIIKGNYGNHIKNFKGGEVSFLRKVDNPSDFACPIYDNNHQLISIVEKPKKPQTQYAITGPHLFDNQVFDFIKELRPSSRGELEIVDLHKKYLNLNQLKLITATDSWADVGTFESLIKTSYFLLK